VCVAVIVGDGVADALGEKVGDPVGVAECVLDDVAVYD